MTPSIRAWHQPEGAQHEVEETGNTSLVHAAFVDDASGTQDEVRGCQAPHPETNQPGGSGGRSYVLTRVSLCQ